MEANVHIKVIPDDIFEPVYVLVAVSELSQPEVARAMKFWGQLLENAEDRILNDPIFEDYDEWFGFGIQKEETVFTERDIFSEPSFKELIDEAVAKEFAENLIAYNKAGDGEGLATHEECETGTYLMQYLVQLDLNNLDLYLRYLDSLDLDHTVSQIEVVFALAKQYSADELRPLIDYARDNKVQLLNDWLQNERAWQSN